MDDGQPSISASQPKKYDVFISFRGEDTRTNIVSFLREKFKSNGIDAYIDDRLERGEEISTALLDAIDHSKFSVVIFSENYATSSWCLDELHHIMQCAEKKLQIVLPVFYHVKPANVRKQEESYAKAFEQLENRSFSATQIQKWRTALTKAANLSGWDSSNIRNDAELVEKIVKHIRGKLKTSPSINYVEKGLVGMAERVEDVKGLLNNGSKVGICGMGGLGKTTLAEVVFKECQHQFDLHCFLRNVREEVEKHGEAYLVKEMFKCLLKEDSGVLDDEKKKMLHQKKLLLVLDDVDSLKNCEALLKDECDWFNSESKVIITSRNKQVLRNIFEGNESIYDLQLLDEKEALELFYLHAFKGKGVDESYIEISKKFVDYAKGVPLALKVLGSHLFGKKRDAWQSLLRKLKRIGPDQEVQKVLKISFDGLEEQQKSIFLDMACFFGGREKNYVKQVLDACYESSHIDIEVLLDKCLITLHGRFFKMHDLLQEMGQSIVRGSHDNPLENYSRLWKTEDICYVLKNNTVATAVKGIFKVDRFRGEVIKLDSSTFEKLPSLRILIDNNSEFQISRDFDGTLPNQLRYLEWEQCPLESLGPNFKPHNLVSLKMVNSKLKKLWNESQDVENLKYVDLRCSRKLTCLPNLSKANLQLLRLAHCSSLVDLPPIKFHDNLDDAEKDSDSSMTSDKLNICLLDISYCMNLKRLSVMSGNIKFINLCSTAIKELHSSIGFLKNLIVLDLLDCKYIKTLPSCIHNLESLEYLNMFGCVSIEKFPELPKSIKRLDLSRTSIQQVDSSSFECLHSLRLLSMNECTKLESLPATICKLESLVKLDLGKCSRLKSFPEILEPMENLEKLNLNESGIEEIPSSIENLVVLNELFLGSCKNLKCIPTTIFKLKSLMNLDISQCPLLDSFPEILEPMEKLQKLNLNGSGIEEIPSSIENLVALHELLLGSCKNLKCIPITIFKLKSLMILHIRRCPQLKSFPEIFEPMEKLHKLCCGSPFYSLLISSPNKIPTDQLRIKVEAEEFKCRKSCSITHINASFTKYHSDGFHDIPFTCCECFLFYSLHIILATQYFQENPEDQVGCFSYSGNAIPQWFNYQSEGSSIEVNLVPSLDNNFSFLGYAICLVVHPIIFVGNKLGLKCEYHFKRNDGKLSKFDLTLPIKILTQNYGGDSNVDNNDIFDPSSSYVYISYMHRFDLCGVEAFFKFDTGIPMQMGETTIIFPLSSGIVKRCGVRLVYRKEFDSTEPLL